MPRWKKPITVELLAQSCANTAISHLGIEFAELGGDFLRALLPVDERTRQPFGLLHGGVHSHQQRRQQALHLQTCLQTLF